MQQSLSYWHLHHCSVSHQLLIISPSHSVGRHWNAGDADFLPVDFTLKSYQLLLEDSQFFTAFLISLERVLLGGGIAMLLTITMAYPLSKEVKVFRARNIYMWILVFTMLFNGGIIPWYMTIRQVGILDTIWALALPAAVQVFNVILLVNFFRGVPGRS